MRVRFVYGSDLDEAANELRSRIDRRRASLPEDIDPPVMYKFDVSQFPIMFLSIRSDEMDAKQLRHFAEKNLQYRFERLPGVAQARVFGQRGATMLEDGDRIRISGAGGAGAKRPQSAPGNGTAAKAGNGPRPKARNSGT